MSYSAASNEAQHLERVLNTISRTLHLIQGVVLDPSYGIRMKKVEQSRGNCTTDWEEGAYLGLP